MSSPESPRNASDSEEGRRSDSEPPPPKKSKKKEDRESDDSTNERKKQKLDSGDDSKSSKKRQADSEEPEQGEIKSKKDRKDGDKERSNRRDRDSDRDRNYDHGRGKDRDRRQRPYGREFERDPPANYERYWGAGPKRSYKDRRERDQDRSYERDNDRDDRSYDRSRKYGSGKVGPRYYGGEKEESDKEESKKNDRKSVGEGKEGEGKEVEETAATKRSEKKIVDLLTSKTGGAYIPPARLKMMQAQITDKSSAAYQRIAWEALKKSIHGHINKVNTGNLATVIRELLQENVVRGCGLLCRSIIQAQAASPTFTRVFAALVAVINSRFPQIGELLLKRVVINFKRGFRRQDKASCISSAIFIAHLVNQSVAHELLALEILVLLVENPTSDSVEVAIAFLKEVVDKLLEVAKKGTMAIQDMLRNILHEGTLDKRVQYIIETMFQIIKVGGQKKLDDEQKQKEDEELLNIVEEEDQMTHIINLDDAVDPQNILDVFKEDPKYEENEASYKKLLHEILGSDSESGEEGSGEDEDSDEDDEDSDGEKKADTIIDNTETNLVALRRTIYLTIQSSLDFEECAHKLMRMQLKPGQEVEMCHMILDCCAEMRTYEKFFGLLAQRFCMINKLYITPFQQIFCDSFATVHRLEINKLRNVAKFFAHLLHTDAISWEVLSVCRLTEEDSTSSSRIFIKILFQELSEYMGLPKLNNRVKDATLQVAFEGLFPRDDPKNTRFAINFFTSIGLGGLTDELREHLKSQPRTPAVPLPIVKAVESSSSSSSSDSSSSSSSSSSSDSSSESDDEKSKKKKKKKSNLKKKSKETQDKSSKKAKSKSERGRDENFDKRDFEREQRNIPDKESRLEWDRNNQRHPDREPRRDMDRADRRDQDGKEKRGDRREFDRGERREFEKGEGRAFDRGERREFEKGEGRAFDRGERREFEKGEGRAFDRMERREPQREDRRDPQREDRRDPQREDRRDPQREDRREPQREDRREPQREDRREPLREERREGERPGRFEKKDVDRREKRDFDRGGKDFEKGNRKGLLREEIEEEFDGRRGALKERRNYDDDEPRRGSGKERRREPDRDYQEKERPRNSERDWQKNGDRERPREKERHHR